MLASKSEQALAWLDADPTRTVAKAVEMFGLARYTIERARAVRAERGTCPHCGQIMPKVSKQRGRPAGT